MRLECFGRENLQVSSCLDLAELLSWSWSWWALVRLMVWWALTLVFLIFHLDCRQPIPKIVRAWLTAWPPFILDQKGTSNSHFLAIAMFNCAFLIITNVDNFSKGYSRSLWLTRTLPMPPMSTSTAQVISYSEGSNSWTANILNLLEVTRTLFFQRPSMLAGKFDEARKHAHSSLQILSRHLPKVVKQFKTFKEMPKIAKQFETLVNARQISYTDIK